MFTMNIFTLLEKSGIKNLIPDRIYLAIKFRRHMGYWMDFKNPKTFCEKLQWLKLYDRQPIYTTMVDKYTVKEYVAKIIGEQYIIPTLGIWNSFEEIDFESLPNQFVLKCTHDSGGLVICTDKKLFDKEKARRKIENSLKTDYYRMGREWPYMNVPKRILAEKYMVPDTSEIAGSLPDYKFFCFNGEPKYCQVIRDRLVNEKIDIYDMDWNHQEFVGLNPVGLNPVGLNGSTSVPRPKHLEEMIDICRKLSKDIPFVRVDLYVIDEKEYFGELTFYPAGGYGQFTPHVWNIRLGELIQIPLENL